jgi:hypothetical protein
MERMLEVLSSEPFGYYKFVVEEQWELRRSATGQELPDIGEPGDEN